MRSRKLSDVLTMSLVTLFFLSSIGETMAQENVTFELNLHSDKHVASNLNRECRIGYTDLRTTYILRFFEYATAALPSTGIRIGNGRKLQCENSTDCYLYSASRADCLNDGFNRNGLQWRCSATVSKLVDVTVYQLRCQEQLDDRYCVFDDSCVLLYSLNRPSVTPPVVLGVVFGGAVIFIGVVVVCVCIRHYRSSNQLRGPSATVPSNTTPGTTTTTTYIHPPPPPMGTLPYLPSYQPPYQKGSSIPPMVQHAPPYARQAAPISQPAFNPAFRGDQMAPRECDAPPPYNTVATDCRAK